MAQPNLNKVNNVIELAKLKAQYKIDFEKKMNEAKKPTRMHTLFFGSKGVGKTYTALNLPQNLKILALSYDGLTSPIIDSLANRMPDIWERTLEYDIEYLDDPEIANDSAFLNYDYLKYILNSEKVEKFKPDIIFHDRVDILNKICEGRMRRNQGLPSIGVVDFSFWKERRAYLSYIHKLSSEKATLGVFYTIYYDDYSLVEFKDKNGNVIQKKEPQYVDIIKDSVPFVVEVEQFADKDKRKNYTRATVQTSKNDKFLKTGDVIDISGFKPLITKERIEVLYPDFFKNRTPLEVTEKNEESEKTEGTENSQEQEVENDDSFV